MAASFDQANGVGTKTASSTTHTVNYPTTVQDDIIIVTLAGNGITSVTPPSGITWTEIFLDNTGNASLGAWWGKQVASPLSSETWTTSSPARQGTWWAVEATGVDTTTPVDVVGTVNSATSTDPTHGGITPGETDTALMYLHCARAQSVSGLTPPSGMTEHYDDGTSGGGSAALYVAGEDLASASATGSRTPSALASSVAWSANLFTLAPSGGTDATATPAVAAFTTAAPAATLSASSTQTATVAAFTQTYPAATAMADVDVTGTVVPFTATNPAASPSADALVAPAVVTFTALYPAASLAAGSLVSPAVAALVAAFPAATPQTAGNADVSPAVVAFVESFPAATPSAGTTATPSVAAFSVTLPSATGSAGSTVQPATVEATVALPAATLLLGGTVTPAQIAWTASYAAAQAVANSTVTPSVVAMAVTIPTPDGVGEITVPTWVHFEGSGSGAGVLEAGTVRVFGLEGRPVTVGGLE